MSSYISRLNPGDRNPTSLGMLVSYLYLQVCANKASSNVFLSTPLSSQTRSLPSVCLTSALFQSFQLSQYLLHLVFAFSLSLASGPSFLNIFCRVSSLSQHLLPSRHYVNILRFKSPIRRYLLFQSSARYSLSPLYRYFLPLFAPLTFT